MRVKHCPNCGFDTVSESSHSSEYGRSYSEWSCEECGWRYKESKSRVKGSEGTHPKQTRPRSEEGTLTEWCSTCNTCAKSGHCLCVGEEQTGYCEVCAKHSSKDRKKMLEVKTYFGKHSTFEGFSCDLCEENKARLKIL